MALLQDLELFLTHRSLLSTSISSAATTPAADALLQRHALAAIFAQLEALLRDPAAARSDVQTCLLALSHLLALPAAIATLTRSEDRGAVLAALASPDPGLRALPLGLLRTLAAGAAPWPPGLPRAALLEEGGALLAVLVGALGDAAPRLGEAAAAALVHLARTPAPGELAALARHLRAFLGGADDVPLVRALGVVAQLCAAGEEACAALGDSLAALLHCALDAADPLLQANVLELLGPLGGSPAGLQALLASPLFPALLQWAGVAAGRGAGEEEEEQQQQQLLLAPAAITALAEVHAAACARGAATAAACAEFRGQLLPGLLALVARVCDGEGGGGSSCDVPCIMHALGCILEADAQALQLMLEDGAQEGAAAAAAAAADVLSGGGSSKARAMPRRRSALRCWLELAESSTSEHRAACLASIARVLHSGVVPSSSSSSSGATAPTNTVPSLLAFLSWLGRACRGDAHMAAMGQEPALQWQCGVSVLAGALSARVPPGDPALSADPAHAARWAAFDALAALVRLPTPLGVQCVFAPGLKLGSALLDVTRPEPTSQGREWVQRVVVGALGNEAAGREAGGVELQARLRAFAARYGKAAPLVPTVQVSEGEYM